MRTLTIHRNGEERALAAVRHARRWWERARGLIGRRLAAGEGMLITPCAAVHTAFMRQPLDLVFLDHQGVVVGCRERVRPYRLAWARRARHTLELAPGTIAAAGIRVGEALRWRAAAR